MILQAVPRTGMIRSLNWGRRPAVNAFVAAITDEAVIIPRGVVMVCLPFVDDVVSKSAGVLV